MVKVKTKQVSLADAAVPARTRKPKPKVAGVPDRSRKRAKDATCFVTEFPIEYSPKQRKKANARFNSGTILYNACLRETLDRVTTMRTDPRWKQAKGMPARVGGGPNTARTQLFEQVRKDVEFNAYSLGLPHLSHTCSFLLVPVHQVFPSKSCKLTTALNVSSKRVNDLLKCCNIRYCFNLENAVSTRQRRPAMILFIVLTSSVVVRYILDKQQTLFTGSPNKLYPKPV